MLSKTMHAGARRCVCTRGTPPGACSAGRISLTLIGHRASVGGSVSHADWSRVNGAVDKSPSRVWIDYIRQDLGDSQSIVAVPVTGSLVCHILFSCRDITWTARSSLNWTVCGTDWVLPAGYHVLLQEIAEDCTMDVDGFSAVDNRAGVTFGVELYVPWDAPEAVVDVSSAGVVPLRNIQDVIGLVGGRDSATESSVFRVETPAVSDVTIVDTGDLPESHVSMPELSELIHKWPPAVINHMMWRQREPEQIRKAAKVKYRQKHLAPCTFCGTLIKYDMYRHVAHRHLELAQLWRCPVLWCTIWRGAPQDLMDHIREAHNVPGEIRKVSLEMLFPPWTVTHQVYAESLTSRHSGISNDMLLFSDIGLSLVHHYRVHKRGPPHATFHRNYLNYRSPTAANGPADCGRATRRCLLGSAMCGRASGCFVCRASTVQTRNWSPVASMGHAATRTDRSLTHGAGPAGCGGGHGV